MADFDFDGLKYIAKNELEIFEQKREERIASFILDKSVGHGFCGKSGLKRQRIARR